MKVSCLTVGPISANCYICSCEQTKQAVLVDPGAEAAHLFAELEKHKLHLTAIVLTHFHFDHVMAAEEIKSITGASIAIHQDDQPFLADPPALFRLLAPMLIKGIEADILLHDLDSIQFGQQTLSVIATPGHSPGGISLWSQPDELVLTGDTLFRDGIGRTDFPGCSEAVLLRSIRQRLLVLSASTTVYPGHGPSTTIGREKQLNLWL
ncbi:MAG: MBL fold metallo-hydrolase [Anaerolineae bacterium]